MTRVALVTREYPPEVYGGAGVHVEYLSRQLSELVDVGVYCFGKPRSEELVRGAYEAWEALGRDGKGTALRVLSTDLRIAQDLADADVVHSHTWYANFAGYLSQVLYGAPHVMTTHSLEPLRPWKKEQLGPGYALSSWAERSAIEQADAVIAVSAAMAADVLHVYPEVPPARVKVVHNGIDAHEFFPDRATDGPRRLGIELGRPYVLFVGRITRQKGITYLLEAAKSFAPGAQVVFCVGAPDTPELEREVSAQVTELAESRGGVFWVEEMLPRPELVQLMSHAAVFVCPSVYEPFGLINVEAMACGAPVVASGVGGIPEVVVDGVTGYLVPYEPSGDAYGSPEDPAEFSAAIAERVNRVLASPEEASRLGAAGRERALAQFTWAAVAAKTVQVYEGVLAAKRA
ncbi:MAG TPA: glycogen synthase [Acidimicrobiales bacterium]|nr:glycogen synthase [Acidimicrobiales bacterium]